MPRVPKPLVEGRVMSLGERKRRERELKEIEAMLTGRIVIDRNRGTSDGDPAQYERLLMRFNNPNVRESEWDLRKRAALIRRNLAKTAPRPLSRNEKIRAEKQIRADREWLQKNMASRRLFNLRSKDPDFEKGVNATLREHDPTFKRVAERYKNMARLLDPDNDRAANLETIRPD